MSFATARARIVTIIEATARTDDRCVSAATKFAHLPEGEGDEEEGPRSRSFWLETNVDGTGGIELPYTPDISGQPRLNAFVTLTVAYRGQAGKRADLDVQIESDMRDIIRTLMTPTQWGTRTVTNLDRIDSLSWRRTLLPDGDVRAKITFRMHYY